MSNPYFYDQNGDIDPARLPSADYARDTRRREGKMTEEESARVIDVLHRIIDGIQRGQITHKEGKELAKQYTPRVGLEHVGALLDVLSFEDAVDWINRQTDAPLLRVFYTDEEIAEKFAGKDRWLKSLQAYMLQQASRLQGTQWKAFIEDLPAMVDYTDKGRMDTWDEAREAVKRAHRLVAMAPAIKRKIEAEKQQAALPKLSEQQAVATPEEPKGLDGLVADAVKKAGIE